MKQAKAKALKILQSTDFFAHLREAMRGAGLAGEEQLGTGVYFVAVSRLQPYPLRLRIQEKTNGTAKHIVKKVSKLLPGDSLITIDPSHEEGWTRLAKVPNGKLVFVPHLQEEIAGEKSKRLDSRQNSLVRIVAVRDEEREVEEAVKRSDVIEGAFACITPDRFLDYRHRDRWLTMVQPDQRGAVTASKYVFDDDEIEVWLEVQRLLQERALLPIVLPEWEQVVVERMSERDERAALQIAVLLQAWRTMCLLRSFQFGKEPSELKANFTDFAATTALCKALFREATWFPSSRKLFMTISPKGAQDGLFHPITGKHVNYKHQPATAHRNLLGLPGVEI